MAKIRAQHGQPAVYNASAPTIVDGSSSALNVDVSGNLLTNLNTKLDATNDAVTAYPLGHSVTVAAADALIKTGAGVLHTLTFAQGDAAPTAGSIIVYDNTAESGTVLFSSTWTTAVFYPTTVTLDAAFATGLYIGFTTTADINVSVSWR